MTNSNDSLNDRLKFLEEEIDSLKIQNENETRWRNVLEKWIFNRFGFDIKLELNNKEEVSKSSEPKEDESNIEIQEDQKETECPEITNSEETQNKLPDKTTFTVTTETKTSIISIGTRPSSTNINIAVVAKKIKLGNESDAVESSEAVNPVINPVLEKDSSSSTIVKKVTPSVPEEITEDTTPVVENTEYLVTLKAKNAIKKVEDRENCYECTECLQQFDNIYKAEGHARHHFETKFKCIDCPLYFEVEQDLILHAQVVHYKIRKRFNVFTCYIGGCPWSSKSPEALRHHRTLSHSESKLKASPANPTMPAVPPSDSSDKNEANSDKTASCTDAEQRLASASVATNTEKDNTQEKSPPKMEVEDLISFKASNGENSTWQCKVCNKAYSEYALAKTHVSKSHFTHHFPSDEKKVRHVVCRICKKAFSNDNWLKRHELAEHRSSIKKYALH